MTVKIVTDSTSDITAGMAKELGITVVPLAVSFGRDSFIDGVTITTDEFYKRLSYDSTWPTTTQPAPGVFADVYNKLSKETDEILVITISNKLSGTHDSALNARNLMQGKCRVAVVNSETVIMGEGMMAIAAAKEAKKGVKLDDLVTSVKKMIPKSHAVMYFDTMKYLVKGGRIGKAKGMVGSLLSVKPILTMRDGEVSPLTRVRSRSAGIESLYNIVAEHKGKIRELAVEHANSIEDVNRMVAMFDKNKIFPADKIITSNISPVIGAYAGPNVLAVSFLGTED